MEITFICDPSAGIGTPLFDQEYGSTFKFSWVTRYGCPTNTNQKWQVTSVYDATTDSCCTDPTLIVAVPNSNCAAQPCASSPSGFVRVDCWTGPHEIDVSKYIIDASFGSTDCSNEPAKITAYLKACINSTGGYEELLCCGSDVAYRTDCSDRACSLKCKETQFASGCYLNNNASSDCWTGCTGSNECYTPRGSRIPSKKSAAAMETISKQLSKRAYILLEHA